MSDVFSMKRRCLACAFSLLFCTNALAADFLGLGSLEVAPFTSQASAISADGQTVVGLSYSLYENGSSGAEAIRWTADEGMQGLGGFIEGYPSSDARGISADGSTIVGYSSNGYAAEAFRWTENDGMQGLGNLATWLGFYSVASDASADGSTVVGYSQNFSGTEAFRWTDTEGMVGLGDLAGGTFFSQAYGTSADGSVIVGSSNSINGREAFRWTSEEGMLGLGFLLGGTTYSDAIGISADGNVIVGQSNTPNGTEAFRWTAEDGMVGLGDLEGGLFYSSAAAVSADGRVVVGGSSSERTQNEAFRWTSTYGMQSIMALLEEEGIDLTGWVLSRAMDVSADGTVIVGNGYSPDSGDFIEAWLVRIDSGLITPEIISQSVSTLLPATESSQALVRESLDTHLLAARHYSGRPGSRLNMYVSGFGGEWNSYTAGGTLGMAWDVNESVRLGGGLFTSTYHENDLAYSSSYELDSFGGTLWAGYEAPDGGIQFHLVSLLAELANDIERGYMNGASLDKSKGSPDGDMKGLLAHVGWKTSLNDQTSFTPFASYTWTEVKIDAYTETGGGFPAQFDSRKDNAEILKVGIEGETQVCESTRFWGQFAYGNRLDDDSASISGGLIGLTDFSLPGYNLDDDWFEADLGFKWQATPNMAIMLTGGSAFGNDQNPEWRSSLGVSWAL